MFKNTKYLSKAANDFREWGIYTKLPIGSKAWLEFWKEEQRRCIYGYTDGSNSITGYHYFFLNYSPILQTEITLESGNDFGQNRADRVKDFPLFYDGHYDYFNYLEDAENAGEHSILLGSRGKGKSLIGGSMCVRNYHHIEESKSYCIAAHEQYLTSDGIISKAWDIMDFNDSHTPFGKRRHEISTALHRKSSTRIINSQGVSTIDPESWNSEIIGVTVGDNVDKVRGKRGKLVILEEIGNFPRLLKAWNILLHSMKSGRNTFGLIAGIGTGGSEGANFEGAEELIKNPEAYEIHARESKEEGLEGMKIGFVYTADVNYEGAMDADGNSDRPKARKLVEAEYARAAKGGNPHAITRRKAEIPLKLEHVLMRITGTKFPVADLVEHLAQVEGHPHKYKQADFIGKLHINPEGQVIWKPDETVQPIYTFPHKDNKNMPGGLIIWEHPYTNNEGRTPYNMYIAGIDSYDHDESQTTSLGSIWVMNTITKRLVAEYTGRPNSEEFYEQCRRILLYYNALGNPENHNKGILDYFERKNASYLFCDQLRIVNDINQNSKVERKKGTAPGDRINSHGRTCLAEYLLEPALGEGNEGLLNLHKIRSIPLLKELILWNIDGNFDRVSALGMLMLLMKEREKIEVSEESSVKVLTDPFWNRHFKKSYNSQIIKSGFYSNN